MDSKLNGKPMNCSKYMDQSLNRTGLMFAGCLNWKEENLTTALMWVNEASRINALSSESREQSVYVHLCETCTFCTSCFQKLKKKMQRGEKAQNKKMLLSLSNSVTNEWSRVTWSTLKYWLYQKGTCKANDKGSESPVWRLAAGSASHFTFENSNECFVQIILQPLLFNAVSYSLPVCRESSAAVL